MVVASVGECDPHGASAQVESPTVASLSISRCSTVRAATIRCQREAARNTASLTSQSTEENGIALEVGDRPLVERRIGCVQRFIEVEIAQWFRRVNLGAP